MSLVSGTCRRSSITGRIPIGVRAFRGVEQRTDSAEGTVGPCALHSDGMWRADLGQLLGGHMHCMCRACCS